MYDDPGPLFTVELTNCKEHAPLDFPYIEQAQLFVHYMTIVGVTELTIEYR